MGRIDLSHLVIKLVNDRITADRGKAAWHRYRAALSRSTDLRSAPILASSRRIAPTRVCLFLYGKQIGNCAGCGFHFPFSGLTVDHILPCSRGGADHLDNLQLLCLGCNSSKRNRSIPEWRAAQFRVGKVRPMISKLTNTIPLAG